MKKFTALLFSLCFISTLSFGQYYYQTNSNPGQNPGGLNTDDEYPNGGGLGPGWTGILGPSVASPTWSANQTIPFSFNFNASPVTQYKVSSTGVLTFTTSAGAAPAASPAALPSASIPDASVCVWGITCPGANDEVVTKTFGTAPNRQHWVFFTSMSLNGGWSYWSIVLEEGSDNIYVVDQRHSGTSGGVTVGVQINGTTAVDVTGSPNVSPNAGTDPTPADNMYYTFIQGTQAAWDVELTSLTNLPYAAAGNLNITGVLTNLGSSTITALNIDYNVGAGPQTDVLSALNITSGNTYNFSHSIPLNVVGGSNYTVNVDVTLAGDVNVSNNSGNTGIGGLTQIPVKTVVGEEKTGTWCGWCPRGMVGLANMEAQNDFIGIAVHNNDPMAITNYDNGTATIPGFSGYPFGGVDRVNGGNPAAANFLAMHNARKTALVPCDVKNIVATYNTTTNQISVSADSEWYGNIDGSYRMSCVIVEDDVLGTPASWWQVNYYAGGGNGAMQFPNGMNNNYNFGANPGNDPVNPSLFLGYDHTARSLSNNSYTGDAGSLPATTVPLGIHPWTFANVSTNVVNNLSKAHAVVMVINTATNEILNAAETPLVQGNVSTREYDANAFNLNVYPNPTNEVSTVSFNLPEATSVTMEVFNAMGSQVFSSGAETMNAGTQTLSFDGTKLPSGIYFVNLTIGEQVITKKISLLK